MRLQFDHVGGGLVCRGPHLTGFAIAGTDRRFVWADARIDPSTGSTGTPAGKLRTSRRKRRRLLRRGARAGRRAVRVGGQPPLQSL